MPRFWDAQRVFLTGGTGFLGGKLAAAMVEAGAEVTCLSRTRERAAPLEALGCEIVLGDVTDPESIVMDRPTTVVHGAAWVALGIPRKKRQRFWETNVEGTRNVLEAAKQAGAKRFCHVSSVAAIGATPSGLYDESRVNEGRVPLYKSYYEETKHAAHLLVQQHHGKLRTTYVMPGVILGLDGPFDVMQRAYARGKLWSLKDDNPTGYVHVDDVVTGTLAAIEHGEGPYLFVEENLTLDQLFALFEEVSGVPRPQRAVSVRTLGVLARIVEAPYRLRGKVPPLAHETVAGAALPLTYSSQRAVQGLGWKPDMRAHLAAEFARLLNGSKGS